MTKRGSCCLINVRALYKVAGCVRKARLEAKINVN